MSDKTRERVRAEFEAHYSKTYNKPPHLIRDSRVRNAIVSDGYTETHQLGIDLNIAYRAWQAAHEMYAPKWISVDDGMPRIGQAILSKDRLGRVCKTTFNGRSFKCDLVVWDHTPVVEWMPLPKQEKDE